MRHRYLNIFVAVAIAVTIIGVWSHHEPIRSWRIVQTRPLADGVSMRVENLFLVPSGTNTLLRFRCRYLGGNPNERFTLRASLLSTANPPDVLQVPSWQVGVPDDGRGGIPMIWEFRTNPSKRERGFILRMDSHLKTGDMTEHSVDFIVPNLPKLTPNGEVDA